jgi:putative ABC transport system permease protein
MTFDELSRIALSNLWHTKLRTVLTALGVVIGIGALVAMVSFGTGMQKNITEVFKTNDLFTSMQVLPAKVNLEEAMRGNPEALARVDTRNVPPLDDRALERIRGISGVETAYPEISFPVKVRCLGQESRTLARGLPAVMARYKPYDDFSTGRFFRRDDEKSVVVNPALLRNLKIRLQDPDQQKKLPFADSLRGFRIVPPDSIVGRTLDIVTTVVDVPGLLQNPVAAFGGRSGVPVKETVTRLTIVGIEPGREPFEGPYRDRGILLPLATARTIPQMGFSSVWELLQRSGRESGYASLAVRVRKISDLDSVKKKVEAMGFGTLALADQLQEIKRGFVILDTMLGAVGTIALVVAALGIINTMVMSILERTREIGIMKAIGGSENEIKCIFFVEAGIIGLLGGIFGLLLGWMVTRIANTVANYYVAKQGIPHVEYFYIPVWLILGAVAFSILVSLLAGLYPAVRAARINPVEALRHD